MNLPSSWSAARNDHVNDPEHRCQGKQESPAAGWSTRWLSRELIPYDLGQATLSIMVAAADLGMAALMQRSATRSWRGGCWAFPRTGSAPG